MSYPEFFKRLTGCAPFPYQVRLANEPWPEVLDVPTGLGKTAAVAAAWMYKRLRDDEDTGRRLVYCLPMRVLVEQTAALAREWSVRSADLFAQRGKLEPSVHVLMGGTVDTEWENSPERSAIVIGTQDMLLSAALNRGFAVSRYKWPVHFALLNNDCLWVFDETQLMGVGIESSAQLQGLRGKLGTCGQVGSLWMSATLGLGQLDTVDHPPPPHGRGRVELQSADFDVDVVRRRVGAEKNVQALEQARLGNEVDESSYADVLASCVLREHAQRQGLTLVIVNRVRRAQAVFEALRAQGGSSESNTVLIHSRYRGADRRRHEQLLVDADIDRIVVATQAVEAGVDVSARTMFTELAPWPSLVQRFGRCNRYGDGEGRIYWIDIDTEDPSRDWTAPYDPGDLQIARHRLVELSEGGDASPATLRKIVHEPPAIVRPVVRGRDLLALFDTTPDLSGSDIDVSRYVRDGEDLDVLFYWREFEREPSPELHQPGREEFCRVSIGAARTFVQQLDKAWRKDRKSRGHLRAWSWRHLESSWRSIEPDEVYPGQTLLLHPDGGGYDPELGWTGKSGVRVPVFTEAAPTEAEKNADDAFDGDPGTFLAGRWVLLKDHLGHVRDESAQLSDAIGLRSFTEALSTAGLWHDVGKAHEVFQRKLLDPVEKRPELGPGRAGVWAKSSHRLRSLESRTHFRHELASALAWLDAAGNREWRFTNLVAYLIAAHHGKVRLSIRSLPGETRPDEPERLFARGIWDGETLPPVEMPDGQCFERLRLDLSVVNLGEGSWLERALELRDAPEIGPFRLALLETVVRVADWRASRKEQEGAYDE